MVSLTVLWPWPSRTLLVGSGQAGINEQHQASNSDINVAIFKRGARKSDSAVARSASAREGASTAAVEHAHGPWQQRVAPPTPPKDRAEGSTRARLNFSELSVSSKQPSGSLRAVSAPHELGRRVEPSSPSQPSSPVPHPEPIYGSWTVYPHAQISVADVHALVSRAAAEIRQRGQSSTACIHARTELTACCDRTGHALGLLYTRSRLQL